jgi:hypothetical protein
MRESEVEYSALEDKLTNKRMRWYRHISRINERTENSKEGFEHECKRKMTNRRLRSRGEQQVRKYVTQRERRLRSRGEQQVRKYVTQMEGMP